MPDYPAGLNPADVAIAIALSLVGFLACALVWSTGWRKLVGPTTDHPAPHETGQTTGWRARFGAPPLVYNRVDLIVVIACATIGQTVYLFLTRISFDCDALTFLHMARYLAEGEGVYLPSRAPGYSIFLIASGQVAFYSFQGTIFLKSLIGMLTPVLIYLTLSPINRRLALAAALLVMASSIAFTYVKAMTPQHFFMLFIALSFYFYSRYYFTGSGRYIFFALVAALLSIFVRGEGLAVLAAMLLMLSFRVLWTRKDIGKLAAAFGVLAIIFLAHGTMRSIILDDWSVLTSTTNWSGRQLFLQPYFIQANNVAFVRSNLLGTAEPDEEPPILIRPENGPESRRFRDAVGAFYEDPENYEYLLPLLHPEAVWGATNEIGSADSIYHQLFGQFDGDAQQIADNVFESPIQIYFDNLWPLFDRSIGRTAADNLFRDVALEAMAENPELILSMAHNASWYVGLDLFGLLERMVGTEPTRPMIRRLGLDNYLNPVFDGAACASNGLPGPMFAEYERDHFKPGTEAGGWALATLTQLQFLRVHVTVLAGGIFMALWWSLLFTRHREFWITLGIATVLMVGVVSSANIPGERYEPGTLPLVIMIACGCVHTLLVFATRLLGGSRHRAGRVA